MVARTSQQLDQARVLRGRTLSFRLAKGRSPPSTKQISYLYTKRTVAFAENHHLIAGNKLLYPRFEFILLGVIFDGRHFQCISVQACAGQASIDGDW